MENLMQRDQTEQLRANQSKVAEQGLTAHDFGDSIVEHWNGFENHYEDGQEYLTSAVFLADGDGPTRQVTFKVVFYNRTADVLRVEIDGEVIPEPPAPLLRLLPQDNGRLIFTQWVPTNSGDPDDGDFERIAYKEGLRLLATKGTQVIVAANDLEDEHTPWECNASVMERI